MKSLGHVVLLAAGSGGDVAPFVSMGKAFAARGIAATLLAPSRYAAYVGDEGLEFESIGAESVFEEIFSGDDVWHPRRGLAASWRYYAAAMSSAYEKVAARWRPDDTALVSSTFAVGARALQIRLGFCNTTVHLSPAVIFSHQQPARWPEHSIPADWPTWSKRLLAATAERLAVDPTIRRALRGPAEQLGIALPPYIFSSWIHSPSRVCYAFPDWFALPAADWPASGVHVGFPTGLHTGGALEKGLEQFVTASQAKLAVMTAGTAVATTPAWVGRLSAELVRLGWRVVLVGGTPPPASADAMQKQILHTPFAPFDRLFPLANLVCHHGGIGTMAQALRAGIPQMLFPAAHDQFDNAARLESLGAGLSLPSDADDAQLRAGIDALTRSPQPQLASLRDRMAAATSAETNIVDRVLADWGQSAGAS